MIYLISGKPYDMKNKNNIILICILGIAAVAISYFIVFSPDSTDRPFFAGKGGDIIIVWPGHETKDDGADDLKTDDEEELSTADSEESEEMLEKLDSVEGLSLRKDTGYIFVGDSRFVAMNSVCGISKTDNLFMVAKVGEGYSWFNSTAMQQIKRIISSGLYKNWKIIICLGINDLGNLNKYLDKYKNISDDYDMTLVSVNPVDHYGSLSNQQIKDFNAGLKGLSLPYIDTFELLAETGYKTTDGLHYDEETGKKIYNGILYYMNELYPDSLTSDKNGILDKASLNKKNSIQSDITAQNKYVKKEVPETTVSGSNTDTAAIEEILRMQEQYENMLTQEEEPSTEEALKEKEEERKEEEPEEEEQREEEHKEEEVKEEETPPEEENEE